MALINGFLCPGWMVCIVCLNHFNQYDYEICSTPPPLNYEAEDVGSVSLTVACLRLMLLYFATCRPIFGVGTCPGKILISEHHVLSIP